jgi:hypothetical protein
MRLRQFSLQCSLFVLASCGALSAASADTVIDNANGYTLNAKGDIVQFASLAFDDKGRITAVGTAQEVAGKAPKAKHVDMKGRTVLPGLIDAHGHVFGLGEMLTQLDLSATTSLAQALKAIGDQAKANPKRPGCAGAAGTRRTGSWAASRRRRNSMASSATVRPGSSASTAMPAGPTAARWRWPASRQDAGSGRRQDRARCEWRGDRRAGRCGPGPDAESAAAADRAGRPRHARQGACRRWPASASPAPTMPASAWPRTSCTAITPTTAS